MAALTEDRNTKFTEGKILSFPVAASTKIYAGGMVAINSSGYAVPAADTAGLKFMGIATEQVDNSSGANGDKSVEVDRKSVFEMTSSGISQSDLLADVYASDDQTVAKSTTNSIKVGKIVKVESATSVWVDPTL